MKRITIIILLILIVLLTSCQKTPENPPVVNKGNSKLIDSIENSNKNEANINSAVNKKDFTVPNRWDDTFLIGDETLVVINSDIIVPRVKKFPAIQVEPDEFTIDVFFTLEDKFMSDCVYYDFKDFLPYTKQEIEELILQIKKSINDPDSDFNKSELSNEEYKEALDRKLKSIERLEKEYKTAPKTVQSLPIKVTEEFEKKKTIFVKAKSLKSNKIIASIMFEPQSIYLNLDQNMKDGNEEEMYFKKVKSLTISQDKAIRLAEETISNMGVYDMKVNCAFVEKRYHEEVYNICFTKKYYNVSETYTTIDQGCSIKSSKDTYSKPYRYEHISILVNDLGIKSIEWVSPMKEINKISESVELIPFEEVKQILKKQLEYKVVWREENKNIIQRKLYIKEIRLGLMRVNIKDSQDKYMMIPVWDFFGYSVDKYKEQQLGGCKLDENNEHVNSIPAHSFLTINAIDGTIIDRRKGY